MSIIRILIVLLFVGHELAAVVDAFVPRRLVETGNAVVEPKAFALLQALNTKDASSSSSSPSTTNTDTDVDRNAVSSSRNDSELFPEETLRESVALLQEATRSFNSSAAAQLLSTLNEMRQNKTEDSTIALYLNTLLERGPDRPLPLWARIRMLSRISKRARLYALRHTLDLTTPPPNAEDEETEDTLEDQMRRRRRALLSLLRQLFNPVDAQLFPQVNGRGRPAIRYLEQKAIREQILSQQQSTNEDMVARRPQDLETPKYEVIVQRPQRGLEIRRYEPFTVCSVAMSQPRPIHAARTDATVADPQMSGARAFGALAGYLFGKNQKELSMKMTTPVLTRPQQSATPTTGGDNEKFMSFVLPSDYWNSTNLAPQPLPGSGVVLQQDQGGDRAVVMFGGYASKKETAARKEQLLKALAQDEEWEAIPGEPVALAQYNDPFTPPWKRLNEVSVAVKRRDATVSSQN